MVVDDHAAEYGKIFGSWQIREKIGTGSKGRTKVYRITKDAQGGMEAGEERALKAVTICEDASLENMTANARAEYDANRKILIEKASNEVFLMKRLEGAPHIVGYLDWEIRDRTGGTDLLIAMHLLDTLEKIQREKDRFSEEDVLQVGMDICRALVRCQEEGIIHRDIKPANIFRRSDGRGGYMLGDFGISKIVDNGMGTSTEIGTPAYAAPEQVRRGSYDSRVDIYSLGLVLYEMSNRNRLPFAGSRYSTEDIIKRRVFDGEELPAPSDAGPALASVILKACAFHPEDRFQTAEEFQAALKEIRNRRITELPVSDVKSELELDPYATMPVNFICAERCSPTAQKAEDIPISKPRATSSPQSQPAQKQNPQSMSKVRPASIPDMKIKDGVLVKYLGRDRDVVIPDGITKIGKVAFQSCKKLHKITISEGVAVIENSAFISCSNLESIVLPDSLTVIDKWAFAHCSNLESIAFPENLTAIGQSAFLSCENLTSIRIPKGVTVINDNAFEYCLDLESIVLPDGLTKIGEWAFAHCEKLRQIIIPEGVTVIEYGAFAHCSNLESIVFPETLTVIGHSAFLSCENLTSVTISENVTMIDEDAFGRCPNHNLTIHTPAQSYAHEYAKEHNIKVQPIVQEGSMPGMEIEDGVLVTYDGPGGNVVIPEGVTAIGYVKSELELNSYAMMPANSFVQEDSLTAQKTEDVPISKEAEQKTKAEAEKRAQVEVMEKAKERAEAKALAVKTGKNLTHLIIMIIRWIFGLSYILLAFVFKIYSNLFCITWILAGLIILPPVTKLIPQFKGRRLVLILACVVLLSIGMSTLI